MQPIEIIISIWRLSCVLQYCLSLLPIVYYVSLLAFELQFFTSKSLHFWNEYNLSRIYGNFRTYLISETQIYYFTSQDSFGLSFWIFQVSLLMDSISILVSIILHSILVSHFNQFFQFFISFIINLHIFILSHVFLFLCMLHSMC